MNVIDKNNLIGKVFNSNNFGNFEIIAYENSKDVTIRFLETGYLTHVQMSNIRSGEIKDKLAPSVFGIGVVGIKYSTKDSISYKHWQAMLKRCYCKKEHIKNPTYKDCHVSENFKSYSYFYEWCNKQVGFGNKDWCLDKDLLIKGNKIYSEDLCLFLPKEINLAMPNRKNHRGDYLIGVAFDGQYSKFIARISRKSKLEHLGYFKTEIEAFDCYKSAKERYMQDLALQYKGLIDDRAYQALINYKVEASD